MKSWLVILLLLLTISVRHCGADDAADGLSIQWDKRYLMISGPKVPGESVKVHYLEAYCKAGSTNQDWVKDTVIKHTSTVVSQSEDGKRIELDDLLDDGVRVKHVITAGKDEVDFRLTATNPTTTESKAEWAQPCVRVDRFAGKGKLDYIPNCFIFLDGKLTRLPTEPWATEARYIPGQVYAPKGINRNDVNPRPLSSLVPSNGLVGCFSADERMILASAWEPYQELFQGVATCVHSDLRIGGLNPGETKTIRGKIYIVPADVDALVRRYEKDFPEQTKPK